MLYDSDSSVQDACDRGDSDSGELLECPRSRDLLRKQQRRPSPEDIFTIQVEPELSGLDSKTNSKRSSGYISLSTSDPGDEPNTPTTEDDPSVPQVTTVPPPPALPQASYKHSWMTSSRASSKSSLSILKTQGRQLLVHMPRPKSDSQFHYLHKKCSSRISLPGRKHRSRDVTNVDDDVIDLDDYYDDYIDDSDDDVTLTSATSARGRPRRGQKVAGGRGSFDPGGSGLLSVWSNYSDLLYQHDGVSWECWVALVVAFCGSAQCRAYTTAMKMVAWLLVLVLILMCLKTYFYGTSFQDHTPHTVQDSSKHGNIESSVSTPVVSEVVTLEQSTVLDTSTNLTNITPDWTN